jgi:uncharacterized phage protein gp47/JayE
VIKTLPEIREDFLTKCRARISPDWDDSANLLINIEQGIIADVAADLWEGVQGVYDSFFPKSATGLNLDNVADIVDVKRIAAAKSTAVLEFTGTVGTVIPEGTAVKVSGTEERFMTTASYTLLATQFSDVTLGVTALANSTAYSVTINSTLVSITSDGSATAAEIVTALKAAIDLANLGVTTTLPTSTTLRINVTEPNSVYPIVVGARLGINSVSDLVLAEAESSGVIKAPANTLNTLLIPVVGITSVDNAIAAVEGRLEETDEELRVRRYESVAIIGASTERAIISNVKNLEGVTAAFVIANRTFTTDVDGRPPKSFEVVVEGGDEVTIAETIWAYHPAGIETYGDITRTITDEDDQPQTVLFSRPTVVHIKMEIDYTKYDEEAFAATGEQGIKDAAFLYGSSLNIGVDVIPQRFFGTIFSNVQGLASLAVRVSSSTDEVTWTPFTTLPIAIGRKENSSFDITRIVVNEV